MPPSPTFCNNVCTLWSNYDVILLEENMADLYLHNFFYKYIGNIKL